MWEAIILDLCIYTSSCDVVEVATDETSRAPSVGSHIGNCFIYSVSFMIIDAEIISKNRWMRGGHVRLTKEYNQLTAAAASAQTTADKQTQTMTRQNDRNADLITSTTVSNSKWWVWLILYLCIHWWSGRWKIRCSRRSICCVIIYPIQHSGCSSRDQTFSHQVQFYMAGLRVPYNIINNCKGRITSNPRCKSNTISRTGRRCHPLRVHLSRVAGCPAFSEMWLTRRERRIEVLWEVECACTPKSWWYH